MKTFKDYISLRENTGIDQNALSSGMSLLLQYLRHKFRNAPMAGTVNVHPEEAGLNPQQIKACQEFGALPNGNSIEPNVVQGYFNPNAHTSFRANANVDPPKQRW